MEAEQRERFSLEWIKLAELERRTGVSRVKLRRLKQNSFRNPPRSTNGQNHTVTKLSSYSSLLDGLLRQEVKICRIGAFATGCFDGSATIVKEYIATHNHLIPTKRQLITPSGKPGRRYPTEPDEACQMDWERISRKMPRCCAHWTASSMMPLYPSCVVRVFRVKTWNHPSANRKGIYSRGGSKERVTKIYEYWVVGTIFVYFTGSDFADKNWLASPDTNSRKPYH